ncbi:MAG TPA: STAS domain-containing protein [Nevskiaceae bacterium]|nr:STAS domain-containing protein [Nevskiaceae bacterium]
MSALTGELSFASVPRLLAQADRLAADARVDLSGVSKADSAGVALLLELTRRAKRAGRTITFSGAPPQLRDLIHFFDLESALQLDSPA